MAVDVTAPAQASSVTLQNTGREPISLQIRIFDWSQAGGEDKLVPTTDVVASPPAVSIPAGAAYTVRIARTGNTDAAGEKSYRMWVDELPRPTPSRAGGGEVDVRIRYDLPVFFHPAGVRTELSWRAYRTGSELVIEATNRGSRHARIQDLKLQTAKGNVSFGEGLAGYVLAGSTRRWTQPIAKLPSTSDGTATVVAGVSGSETRQPVTIATR
ncbi:fimbrial biogenesis chaperone [Sphingomonas molluscorum]|uniref:fimbrial biogenesis chaperone n=1 Tax=Sphingomonas TaxID=13687 RepID=UPI001404EAEA|nr:molecular chaperone [Sphingomonas sp. JUb134]MBM7405980.1 fimbrial chaperone protein [Sphingomonas sp. JUb134]